MRFKKPFATPAFSSTSRREFLSGAAALAGAAAAGACASERMSAIDATPVPKGAPHVPLGADETLKVAVIGCGGMGAGSDGILGPDRKVAGHLDAFLRFRKEGREKLDVIATCDVNKKRREFTAAQAGEQQGIAVEPYADYRKLLEREDLHGVLIATPEHWHAKMAEDAIAAGKDVYVEKPMTLRLEEALRLRKVAQQNDAIVQVGTQFMMLPKYAAARDLIAAGAIGPPTLAQTSYCRNSRIGEWNYYEIDPELRPGPDLDWEGWLGPLGPREWDTKIYHRWRRYRDFSTGIIGDLLVHKTTPILYALDCGWPVRVTAHGAHIVDKEMENHDQVFLLASFESGLQVAIAGSTCNEVGLEDLIRGHMGTLYLAGNNCVLRPEAKWVEEVDEQTIECPGIADQDELRLDWLHSMRTREPNRSGVEFATQVMTIVDLSTRSMWDGQAWAFDPRTLSPRIET